MSWLRKNLLWQKIGEKLLNFKPWFLVTYQSLKLQKFLTFQSTLQDKLVTWDWEKESFQYQNENKGLTSLKRPNKLFLWRNQLSTLREERLCIWLQDKAKIKKQKWLLLSNISKIYAQFKNKNPERNLLFNIWTLMSKVVHIFWCHRYTQRLHLYLSPKFKTYVGSNEFFFQLQTNDEVVCMWCWQKWLHDGALW